MDNKTIAVQVFSKPNVSLNCPSYNEVNENDSFTCVGRDLDGDPPSNVTWYKDDKQIGETKMQSNTLTLTNVTKADNGSYTCEARNYPGDKFVNAESIVVQVRFQPNTKINIGSGCDFLFSRSCIVTCESTGFPAPSHIISHNDIVVSNTKTYTINVVEHSDDGIYKCVATNPLGNDSDFANLTIRAPPRTTPFMSSSSSTPQSTPTTMSTKKANREDDGTAVVVWHIVVSLVSGIILGFFLAYIIWCCRHCWCRNRKPERNPDVDTTYQELDLTKMNTEENYQSLERNASADNKSTNDEEESTYTKLSETRDVENNYQSLT